MMIGFGITSFGPLRGGASKHHPMRGPLSNAHGLGIAVVRGHRGRVKGVDERLGLLVNNDLFRH